MGARPAHITVCLDDTDMPGTRGTNKLALAMVRWLRPAFQAPQAATPAGTQLGLEGMEVAVEDVGPEAAKDLPPWPKEVGAQLKAARDLVLASPLPSSAEDVARCFKGARRAAVQSQLGALEELGILASFEAADGTMRWSRASG